MTVWNRLIDLQNNIIVLLDSCATEVHEEGMHRFNQSGWINRVWTNNIARRAHVDVVDARNTKGLWMMHVCIFPHCNDTAPIYGLDVIAGEKKVTGFFHDFSPTVEPTHSMIENFSSAVSQYHWKKERTLPEWAKAIFSDHMVAVGNVNTDQELLSLIDLSYKNLVYWLSCNRQETCDPQHGKNSQNRYAYYQKQNPHTPRTMKALGLDENDVDLFIQQCLFPEL